MKNKIIFATSNEGKMKEVRSILEGMDMEVFSMKEAGIQVEVVEDGKTFEENAVIKAVEIQKVCNEIVLADDSGLCVSALGGAPGVYSARYASENGENATDSDNVEKLLHEMENIPDEKRQAAFVCAVAGILIKPNLPEYILLTAEGNMPGVIARETHGNNGFGYDPVLFLPEYGKCVAELTPEEKNTISHRGQALRRLAEGYYGLR